MKTIKHKSDTKYPWFFLIILALAVMSVLSPVAEARIIDIITTAAGRGLSSGAIGDGGFATSATIPSPGGVYTDSLGNYYIAAGSRVRMVAAVSGTYHGIAMTAGRIYTVAGNPLASGVNDGGPATSARVNAVAVTLDRDGNLYIADTLNHRIRKVNTSGIISTVAGSASGGTGGYAGDGGPAVAAELRFPSGVAVDNNGHIYIADTNNHRVRLVPSADGTYFGIEMSAGNIYTIAGTGTSGYNGDGISAVTARLSFPRGLALDGAATLHIADRANHRVRKLDATGVIHTVAGVGGGGYGGDGSPATTALLFNPSAVAFDVSGKLYIADRSNNRIRMIDNAGIISTVAGVGGFGGYAGDGGDATSARLSGPDGVAVAGSGRLYLADTSNHRIRAVDFSGAYYPFWESGYPKTGVIDMNSVELLVKTDEGGAAYFVVLNAGANPPSSSQVKAGQNAAGAPVDGSRKGTVAVYANAESAFSAVGLQHNTNYDIYVVAEAQRELGVLQILPVKFSIKTTNEPWRAAESCADCHGITADDFSPPLIDRENTCSLNCHNPELDGWHNYHGLGDVSLSPASLNASSSVLHAVHSSGWADPADECSKCHYRASCSSCHLKTPHGDHGASQIASLSVRATDGTGVRWESFSCGTSSCHNSEVWVPPSWPTIPQGYWRWDSAQMQAGRCSSCHTVGKAGHTDVPRVHSDFSATTDACAACHVAHAAPGPKLMRSPTQTDLCLLCHGYGASASPFDVQQGLAYNPATAAWEPSSAGGFSTVGGIAVTSRHNVEGFGQSNYESYNPNLTGYIGTIPGGSSSLTGRGLTCSSCHDPHGGTGNVRLLRNVFMTAGGERTVRATTGLNKIITYDQGFSEWCSACHNRFLKPEGSGSTAEDFNGVMTYRHSVNVSISNAATVTNRSMDGTPLQTGKHDPQYKNTLACISCHRAHGTAATASGLASAWRRDTDPPDSAGGSGSALLRMSGRGVCWNCHGAAQRNLP